MTSPLTQWCSARLSRTAFWAPILALCASSAHTEPVELNESSLSANAESGVVIFEVNWGRRWGCAGIDNAQLQALTFSQWPDGPKITLKTPSRLFVDDTYKPYALVVEPGEYHLTYFDVKVAKSVRDVGHLVGDSNLFIDGKPAGGSFSVGEGEFVYIGHFSLDCSVEPIPWRYYVDGEEEFKRYVEDFRTHFPFVGDVDVEFRLFRSDWFAGN